MESKNKKTKSIFSFEEVVIESLSEELFYYIRLGAMKYNAFIPPVEDFFNAPPVYEKIHSTNGFDDSIPNLKARYCVDVKEILGYDRAIRLAAMLLLGKIVKENPRPQIILALETTGFTLAGAILVLHDLFFPGEKLEACFIRKKRKTGDLGRLIDGARGYAGKRAVFVDDFLNRGSSLKKIAEVAEENGILLQKGFFVVKQDEHKKHEDINIPTEGIFTVNQIRDPKILVKKNDHKYLFEYNEKRSEPIMKKETKDPLWQIDLLNDPENKTLSREDIELVRLAKDASIMSVMSGHEASPILKYDGRGSFGYLPFLGKYLKDGKTVVVKINKREFHRNRWINRQRGCTIWGEEKRSTAQNVVGATVSASKKSLRLDANNPRGPFHKPIWPGELGSLSFFVFVEEKREWIKTQNLKTTKFDDEKEESGLLIRKDEFIKVIFDDLGEIMQSKNVLEILFSNLANREGVLKSYKSEEKVEIIKISGRWLWLPERPKKYFFNHAYRK